MVDERVGVNDMVVYGELENAYAILEGKCLDDDGRCDKHPPLPGSISENAL